MRDLYNELEIMTNVGYHPNLVNLLGACTQDGLYHLFTLRLNSFTFALVYLCTLFLTLSLPNVAKGKFRPNFQTSFSKIVRNK